jgi:hypothetical protein
MNQNVAVWALDFPAGKLFIAQEVLLTMRTGEFEFAHKLVVCVLIGGERPQTSTHCRVTNQCGMPGQKGSKIFGKVF